VNRRHWSFDDPSRATGSEAERLEKFRSDRDQVERDVRHWLRTNPS
jgi:hypothetical protein